MDKNNIYIRKIKKEDLSNTLVWLKNKNLKNLMGINRNIDEISQNAWFKKLYEAERPTNIVFAICLLENDQHIGNVNLSLIDYENKNARFAIFIAEDWHRGKGFGIEASKKAINFGFNQLKLNKIYLTVFTDNIRAISMYEKIGFKCEGRLRKHSLIANNYKDQFIYGLLREDLLLEP